MGTVYGKQYSKRFQGEFLYEPEKVNYHRKVLAALDEKNIYIVEGKGARIPTYNFKIPSTEDKATAIIQANGKACIDFSKLSNSEKERLISKLKKKLKIEFDSTKVWPFIGTFGENIYWEEMEKLINILTESKNIKNQ